MQRKLIGAVLSFILLFTNAFTALGSYNPELYTQENIIENTLTNYQIFARNNADIYCHTVGGVAIGGSAIIGSFGDVNVSPSYIGHIISAGQFAQGGWLTGDLEQYRNTECYYSTAESDINFSNFTQKSDFINFNEVFEKIQTQCNKIAESSYTVSIDDCKMAENSWEFSKVELDLSKHSSYNIPYSIYEKIDAIDFIGVDGNEQLAKGSYSVSITDVDDKDIKITFGYSNPGSDKKRICINGQELSNNNSFKNIISCENGGQMNLKGMTLIWNFPDAQSNIELEWLAGHIAAPNAHVKLLGGNYEGGVIADSIYTNSEGHFFSYFSIETLEPLQDDSLVASSETDSSSEALPESSSEADSSSEFSNDDSSDIDLSLKCEFHYTDDFGNDLLTNEFSRVSVQRLQTKGISKVKAIQYFNPKAPRFLDVQGYKLLGWQELNDDGSVKCEIRGNDIDEVCNKLEEMQYAAGSKVTFKAIYEIPDDPYNLTVTNGSVYLMKDAEDLDYSFELDQRNSYKFANYELVKLSAPDSNEYGSFQYWTLNGMVYSYDSTIFFSTWCDADFEAVFKNDETEFTPVAFINNEVQEFGFETTDTNYHKITFDCAFYIPDNAEFVSAGIIFTPSKSNITDLSDVKISEGTLTNLPVKTAISTAREDQLLSKANNQILMSLTGMKNGVSRYARTFLIYKTNGECYVVFSDSIAGITTSLAKK